MLIVDDQPMVLLLLLLLLLLGRQLQYKDLIVRGD